MLITTKLKVENIEKFQSANAGNVGGKSLDNRITYAELIEISNLEAGLARTQSGRTPGIDGELKANFTQEKLQKLHKELKQQKYQPKPNKRIGIPKPKGGVRYLGIASQRDKVVQGSLLNLLEKKLDPMFLDCSKGFRPNRNCHDALKDIKYKWQNVTWLISVDIEKCFDKIQHKMLLELLSEHVDQVTVELVQKLIRVGYIDIHNLNDRKEYQVEGVPQGSLLSPIFCNLVLHELDKRVVEELLPAWNRGDERQFAEEYLTRKKQEPGDKDFLKRYPELRKPLGIIKHNRYVQSRQHARDSKDENFRRLYYTRYADDFLFGFVGTKEEATQIVDTCSEYLEKIKLSANQEKSSIKHSGDNGILYLGVYIKFLRKNRISVNPSVEPILGISSLKSISINNAQLRAPVERLLQRAVERGYAKRRNDGTYRATSCRKLGSLTEKQIVVRYSSIIRGIVNYYSCVNSRSDLWAVVSLYRKACALVLADKLKLRTAAQVFKKFGPKLIIRDERGKIATCLDYPETLKTKINFRIGKPSLQECVELGEANIQGTYKSLKKGNRCEVEGCNSTIELEAHHVNPMKNVDTTGYTRSIIAKARKTITLCGEHHKGLHKGL